MKILNCLRQFPISKNQSNADISQRYRQGV